PATAARARASSRRTYSRGGCRVRVAEPAVEHPIGAYERTAERLLERKQARSRRDGAGQRLQHRLVTSPTLPRQTFLDVGTVIEPPLGAKVLEARALPGVAPTKQEEAEIRERERRR